ncbi:hypothetical protein FHS32_003069 [Streptomyces albaduncus]|uniref:Uncharacterized protein n=1 Tax=Streptomyces griseoloalbus TaxID=67303 RepID=A0A7W8F8R7_9ACTN|nr:hypothetical protein [Streptomyces albaduncus]
MTVEGSSIDSTRPSIARGNVGSLSFGTHPGQG